MSRTAGPLGGAGRQARRTAAAAALIALAAVQGAAAAPFETALVSRLGTNGASGDGPSGGTVRPLPGGASSVAPVGISSDGRRVLFLTEARNFPDAPDGTPALYVKDVATGTLELVSRADGAAGATLPGGEAAFSRNGFHACWVTPDGRLYLRDLAQRRTRQVAGSALAARENDERTPSAPCAISNDGTRVAYATLDRHAEADADDEGDVYVHDLGTESWTLLSDVDPTAPENPPQGQSRAPVMTPDGRFVAFWMRPGAPLARKPGTDEPPLLGPEGFTEPGYANNSGQTIVVLRDTATGATTMISRPSGCGPGAPADRGRPKGTSLDGAYSPSISDDGRLVAFQTRLARMDPEAQMPEQTLHNGFLPTQVYVRDVATCRTTLVSRRSGAAGAGADAPSSSAALAPSGRLVAFESLADNLDPEVADSRVRRDVYVRDLLSNRTTLASRSGGVFGAAGNADSTRPALDDDGRVAFASQADNLAAVPTEHMNVFYRDALDRRRRLPGDIPGKPELKATASYRPGRSAGFAQMQVNEYVRLSLTLKAVNGRARRVVRAVGSEGTTKLSLPRDGLAPGRYELAVEAADFAGDKTRTTLDVVLRGRAPAVGADVTRARRQVEPESMEFSGNCSIEGLAEFAHGIGYQPRQTSVVVSATRGQGSCTGTLNGREVRRVPVDVVLSGAGTFSCGVHPAIELAGELLFTRGTATPIDDRRLGLRGSGGGYLNRTVFDMHGDDGGRAALVMSGGAYASLDTLTQQCAKGTARRVGQSLRLTTVSALRASAAAPPPLEVALRGAREPITQVLRRGLRLTLGANAPVEAELRATAGRRAAGSRRLSVQPALGGTNVGRLRIHGAARRRLRRARRPEVTVQAVVRDITGATTTVRLRVRLPRK